MRRCPQTTTDAVLPITDDQAQLASDRYELLKAE